MCFLLLIINGKLLCLLKIFNQRKLQIKKSSIITVFCHNHKNFSSPPGPLKKSSQNPIFIQNLNFFTFFLDTKSNTSCASAALTQALRKCLIPPKRSLQSFLKLKKIGVSHQNRAIKKKSRKTEKTAILTPISLSLFLFIYI